MPKTGSDAEKKRPLTEEEDWTANDGTNLASMTFYSERKRQKKNSASSKLRPMRSNVKPLPDLSRNEKKEKLAKIAEPLDRNLQVVLWECNCNYVLLDHQFKGVRALASLPADFPGPMKLKPCIDQKDEEALDDAVFDWTVQVLKNAEAPKEDHRGILMADVMGLGKTVQAIAACILRTAICQAKGQPEKPSIIVSPNDAVLKQWQDTLVKAGVEERYIYRFAAKQNKIRFKGNIYVLCNRYDLQTETRYIFGLARTNKTRPHSPLFPNTPKQLFLALKNQYQADQGKAKNVYRLEKESIPECITRFLRRHISEVEPVFRTVIIDEAHFLKNISTYWGLAAGMLGLHSERMIPMTGTPYNNNNQDLASLMAFVDPSLDSAREKWWNDATGCKNAPAVVSAVSDWNNKYLIRRDKSVIAKNLPNKTISKKHVAAYPLELQVYETYEASFMLILEKFSKISERTTGLTPKQRALQKKYHQILVGIASCMRMALIHPVLPGGGRDFTIFFSPTRKKFLKKQEKPNRCVCCLRVKRKDNREEARDMDAYENLGDNQVNDENDDFLVDGLENGHEAEEAEKESDGASAERNKGEGGIVPIPPETCFLAGRGLRHFACETCLEALQEACLSCPLCQKFLERVHLNSGKEELLKRKKDSTLQKDLDVKIQPEDMELPRRTYCRDIMGGFRASAKLESIIADFEKVPKNEKVLIASFFKGSLDLLEAIFHELGAGVARFDGDIGSDERENELEKFKTEESCRVLLMTVQTGGTGLNVTCANHVVFVDRFWNPFVMEQCEDRCYRLGQEKDVYVTYHDVSYTIDDVMAHINKVKTTNATIILADGSTLSASTAGLSFNDISGVFGNALRASSQARISHVSTSQANIMEPMPPSEEGMFDSLSPLQRQPQFTSITDAIANMLGYITPNSSATSAARHNSGENRSLPSIVHQPKENDEASNSDTEVVVGSGKTESVLEEGGNWEEKPSPIQIVSTPMDVKPIVTPSFANGVPGDLNDSDEDSIPDAVMFKKRGDSS